MVLLLITSNAFHINILKLLLNADHTIYTERIRLLIKEHEKQIDYILNIL